MSKYGEELSKYRGSSKSLSSLVIETDSYFLNNYGSSSRDNLESVPVPGNIYTFSYSPSLSISESVEYLNRYPLVLYLNSEKKGLDIVLKCIDLSVTPPSNRIDILGRYYDSFYPMIEESMRSGSPIKNRMVGKDVRNIFNGTGYEKSVHGFLWKGIEGLKKIKYEDWSKVPFLKYTFIEGKDVNEIYSDYKKRN
jgi:hypothetical protein